jgi:hypothetical protein
MSPAIQMSDALSRNVPKLGAGVELLLANCMARGRRQFVEVGSFPAECRYVLETLGGVYANDAVTKEQGMTPSELLEFHRQRSQPLMETLERWMQAQFSERKVEPNSGLGNAITYMQRHWKPLTLPPRVGCAVGQQPLRAGAETRGVAPQECPVLPHDERRSGRRPVHESDSYLSTQRRKLIHYLVELIRHAAQVAASPRDWMPWSYQASISPR